MAASRSKPAWSTRAAAGSSTRASPRTAVYAGASYGAFMDDDNQDLFGATRSVFVKLSYGWQP